MVPDLPHEDTQSSTFAPVRFGLLAISTLIATSIGGCGELKVPDQPVTLRVSRPSRAGRPLPIVEASPGITGNAGSYDKPADANQNFSMALDLLVLVETNQNGQHNRLIDRLVSFLKAAQWNEPSGVDRSDVYYGGSGPGGSSPPDLFHTAIAIEALHEAGVPASDPYMQRALVFVSRCQNLKSRFNPLSGAGDINDGGFAPVVSLENKRANGKTPQGEHRSCGSMTCAGLKSLIYAGASRDDFRVQAAMHWLQNNFTLDSNPGMPKPRRELFFYYYSLAKTMNLLDVDLIVNDHGVNHDWRKELAEVLLRSQRPDGSWRNADESDQLYASDPVRVTTYAVLALRQLSDHVAARHLLTVSIFHCPPKEVSTNDETRAPYHCRWRPVRGCDEKYAA